LLTDVTGLAVKDIDTRSAVIAWSAAKESVEGAEIPVQRYSLRYGVAIDEQGNILQAKETSADVEGWESTIEYPLSELTPGTLYYVDLNVDPLATECSVSSPTSPSTHRITFVTDSENGERSNIAAGRKNLPSPTVTVQPNPASDQISVIWSESSYTSWTLTTVNGIHLRSGQINSSDNQFTIKVTDIQPGLYIVTLKSKDKAPVSKTFVVQHP
jgi:hypothetical protein